MWFLGCILALAAVVSASANTRFTLCGRQLAEALALVCDNNYYAPREKRSVADFSHSSPVISFLERHRRDEGIVDECCRRKCSINELRSYCGN
ncbi:Bombyxin A-2-like protein, partial [Stegodyphus mimosarum]